MMVSGAKLTVLVLLGCSLLAGCQATRPLLRRHHSGHHHNHHGRKLMSANWGQFTCSGMDNIGFGTQYSALALPLHGLVMGNFKLLNRGEEPFGFQTGGFRLSGLDGDVMDGELKCPDRHVPAGGVLECGFVAPAAAATDFNSLTPFFVPEESNRPCFCRQSYDIDLFNDGVLAPLGQPVPLPTPQQAVRGLANAFEEVFGGSAFHEAVTKAAKWEGDILGLANSITNSIFGIPDADNTINTNNGALDSDNNNNGLFSISIRVGAGPDAPIITTPTPTEGPTAVDTTAPIVQPNLPTGDKQADAAAPHHQEPAKTAEPQPQTVAAPSKPQDTAAPKVGTPVPTIPITEPAAKPSSPTQDAAKDSKPAVDDKPTAPVAAAPVKQTEAPAKEAPRQAETKPETKVDPAPVAALVKQTVPTPTKEETPPMPAKETLPSPPKQEAPAKKEAPTTAPAKEAPAAPKPTSGVDSKVDAAVPPTKADSKPEATKPETIPKTGSAGPVTAPTTPPPSTTAPVNTVAPVVGSNPPAAKDTTPAPAAKDVTKPGATSPVAAPKHA